MSTSRSQFAFSRKRSGIRLGTVLAALVLGACSGTDTLQKITFDNRGRWTEASQTPDQVPSAHPSALPTPIPSALTGSREPVATPTPLTIMRRSSVKLAFIYNNGFPFDTEGLVLSTERHARDYQESWDIGFTRYNQLYVSAAPKVTGLTFGTSPMEAYRLAPDTGWSDFVVNNTYAGPRVTTGTVYGLCLSRDTSKNYAKFLVRLIDSSGVLIDYVYQTATGSQALE